MKYRKGTFVIVPNIQHLKGMPSEMQVIFVWLCHHADENGMCFPSRRILAQEAGCGIKTVDKYLIALELAGLIEKTERFGDNGSQTSNEYNILVNQDEPTPFSKNGIPLSVEKGSLTISSINSIQLTEVQNEIPSTEVSFEPIQEVVQEQIAGQLPPNRGLTRIQRVTSIYKDLYRNKYGCEPTLRMAQVGGCIDTLAKKYTEVQIAALLIVFFEWKGMDGSTDFEQNKLVGVAHPFGWFYGSVNQYEVYLRNVHGLKFDDEGEVIKFVGTFMRAIKK